MRDEQKAELIDVIDNTRRTIGIVTQHYYGGSPEFGAACRANDALLKLGEALGASYDFMRADFGYLCTEPEKQDD
ncbi:hypothetical protein [Emcibacter sp. SYSU 3D8]|uniref:hypothetical protein n=1 Tax=Emcibacter sp. SYSU 3D8 TaxID=3133969 RepID=UPI0031FEA607